MPVDTHVFRVSDRLGLTTGAKTPLQTEHQLTAHIPPELLPIAHHWLILHGRYVCLARRPKCDQCGLTPWCRYYGERKSDFCDDLPIIYYFCKMPDQATFGRSASGDGIVGLKPEL